jgi:hypothetical protein
MQVVIVPQDEEISFDELWAPGVLFYNYLPCWISVTPDISEVPRTLAANSISAFRNMELAPSRRAHLQSVRSGRIYIGRNDVITMKLDGGGRQMVGDFCITHYVAKSRLTCCHVQTNFRDLIKHLNMFQFQTVNAAEFSEEEKAYIFQEANVIVLEIGAGLTNLLFAPPGAKVIFLCPPSMDKVRAGNNMCDWAKEHYVSKFLRHLNIDSTVLRHGVFDGGPNKSLNQKWHLRSVEATIAAIKTFAGIGG